MKLTSFAIGLITFSLFLGHPSPTPTQPEYKTKNPEMSQEETAFLESTLSQISTHSTKEEVFDLLGKPSRTVWGTKFIWDKQIGQYKQRVIVFIKSDKAYELRFDGGHGRFYYVKDLKTEEETVDYF